MRAALMREAISVQSETIRATCRSASRSDASCTRGDLASRATEPAVRSGGEMLPLRFTRRGRAPAAAAAAAAAALIVVRHRAATTCRCRAAACTGLGAAFGCRGRVVLEVGLGGESAVVSTCMQGRSSACNQRTLRWSWMRGPRAVQSFCCTSRWHMRWSAARFVDAKDLRRPSSCDQSALRGN